MRHTRLALQPATFALALLALPLAGLQCSGTAPPLVSSVPSDGAGSVLRTTWIDLRFSAPLGAVPFVLQCDSEAAPHAIDRSRIAPARLVLNPVGELPAGDTCHLSWPEFGGPRTLTFSTASAGAPVAVVDDRTSSDHVSPYPDDFFLQDDPTSPTGLRHAYPVPTRDGDVEGLFTALLTDANTLDGFSPIAHMVLELTDAVDASTLPQTPAESLDPLASIALLDLAPNSPSFGTRVPFSIQVRNGEETSAGLASNTLLLFPAVPLEPGGRYGLVVTRRVAADSGRPLDPSDFFRAALAPAAPGEPSELTRTRALADDVLAVASLVAQPFIPADDVAFAARVSVRTTDGIQDDVQTMKRQILAAPPPTMTTSSVVSDSNPNVAALVRGTWQAPEWRDGNLFLRDAQGRPVLNGAKSVCFRLALPQASLSGPAPIVVYQHGNPGQSETEVLSNARNFLAQGGFAVVGFTDVLNREVSPPTSTPGTACINYEHPTATDETRITNQVLAIFGGLLVDFSIPDIWNETLGEQLAFVRAVQGLGTLDLLPLGHPDGIPDLDPTRIVYMGISEGANNGQAFAAYAPEVRAASIVVGGARLMETLIHQQAATFLDTVPQFFPSLSPADIWTGTALFQADFDRQDKHNHGRFVYRERAEVPLFCNDLASCQAADWCDTPGHCTTHKPSVLLSEGLTDSLVPNNATDSAAFQMGPLPHLAPVQHAVPFLDVVSTGSVVGNIDPTTTAAFYQYVPVGVPGVPPTPGCKSPPLSQASSIEGHFCAQSATESRAQRLIFFDTALDPTRAAPTIVDPLPYYPEGTPLFPLPSPLP